jgi:hypothetical protein
MSLKITELKPSDKNRKIIYTQKGTGKTEEGWVSSWNDHYIFVRFQTSSNGQACDPNDLQFLNI